MLFNPSQPFGERMEVLVLQGRNGRRGRVLDVDGYVAGESVAVDGARLDQDLPRVETLRVETQSFLAGGFVTIVGKDRSHPAVQKRSKGVSFRQNFEV